MLRKIIHLVLPNEGDSSSTLAEEVNPEVFSLHPVWDVAECQRLLAKEEAGVMLISGIGETATVLDVLEQLEQAGQRVPIICIADIQARQRLLEERRPELWDVLLPSELDRLTLSLENACVQSGLIQKQTKLAIEAMQARALLADNQRSITIGRMLGSIAHEINNPLEAIANLLFLTERNITEQEFIRKCVKMAEQELTRVGEITKQMLTFHRDSKEVTESLVTEAVESVLSLHGSRLRRYQVEVRRIYQTEGSVQAHPGELRQMFSNLISNAIDAMPNGGRLTIRVRRGSCRERALCITVADTGYGMPRSIRERVGELYLTTKGESGTGIGLWVTRQLIEKYGGTLRVRSSTRSGRSGTHFRICFADPSFEPASASTQPERHWGDTEDLRPSHSMHKDQMRRA